MNDWVGLGKVPQKASASLQISEAADNDTSSTVLVQYLLEDVTMLMMVFCNVHSLSVGCDSLASPFCEDFLEFDQSSVVG